MKRILIVTFVLVALYAAWWNVGAAQAAQPAPEAVCNWTGSSGNWSDASHWSCGAVPGEGDTAVLDNYQTVTLDMNVTVASLLLEDHTLTGSSSITVTEAFTMSGFGSILDGTGMTTIADGATFTFTGCSAGNGGLRRSIDNYGTIVIGGDPANRIDVGANVVITNQAGSLLDIQSNRPWLWYGGSGDRPVINNSGTIRKNITGEASMGDIQVNNNGLIQLTNGGLYTTLYAQTGGVQVNNADAYLNLGGTAQIYSGATFNGSGWIIVTGTMVINADITILNMELHGTVDGSGNLTITGELIMADYNPSLRGTGKTIIDTGATLTLTGCSAGQGGIFRSLDNFGTIIIGGDAANRLDIGDGVIFTNKSNGEILIQSDRPWLWYPATSIQPVILNLGTIAKSSTGLASISGVLLNSSGLITISGGLRLSASSLHGEILFNDADAYLDLTGADNVINFGVSFEGPGWVIVSGSSVLFNTDISILNVRVTGTLDGNGELTITGRLEMDTWNPAMAGAGKTIIAEDAVMSLTGCGAGQGGLQRSIDNFGTMIVGGDGRLDIADGVVITNKPSGLVEVQSNRQWLWYPGIITEPAFNNEGTVTKAVSGETYFEGIPFNNTTTGLITLTSASFHFTTSSHSGLVQLMDATASLNLTSDTHQFNDGAIFSGPGWVYLNAYLVTISGEVSGVNFWQTGGWVELGDPDIADLTVTGEFKRSGGDFQSLNGSTLTFDGDQTQLNLEVATSFEKLTVVTDTLLIEVNPTDYATVTGTLSNYGVIRKTQAVASTGSITFGLTAVAVNVQTQGTLTQIQVDRIDRDHANASVYTATGRYWSITPTGADYSVDLTLPQSLYESTVASVCRYADSTWDCASSSATETTVTRTGITELSDWAVGQVCNRFIPFVMKT